MNAIPCVGDLLRLGPEEGSAVLDFLACNVLGEPKAGFIAPNPVNPTPGVVVTPNNGLGLSDGPGELRDSSEGVALNGLSSGFLSDVGAASEEVEEDLGSDLAGIRLGAEDQADGPAFACPNGEIVEAKDKKPLEGGLAAVLEPLAIPAGPFVPFVGGGEGRLVTRGLTSTSESSRGRLTDSPFKSSF